ncbi:MAG: hypothetical protein E3J69_07140, partial [Anaerolineales bacterium]
MNSALDKLSKFLRLEAERGYDNRAVVGGLQQMLEPWAEEAKASNLSDSSIELVVSRLRDYGRLSPNSRYESLQGLWNRLRPAHPELADDLLIKPPAGDSPPSIEAAVIEADTRETIETQDALPSTPLQESAKEKAAPTAADVEKKESTPSSPPVALTAPLTTVQGIGPKSAKTLSKLGLENLGDLLWHLPRRYDDYSQLETI